jgi:hypothetical protein
MVPMAPICERVPKAAGPGAPWQSRSRPRMGAPYGRASGAIGIALKSKVRAGPGVTRQRPITDAAVDLATPR